MPASPSSNRELCRRIREMTCGQGMTAEARARVMAAIEPLRGAEGVKEAAGAEGGKGGSGHPDK